MDTAPVCGGNQPATGDSGGGTATDDASGGEDDDTSSSSVHRVGRMKPKDADESSDDKSLREFREQWRQEIASASPVHRAVHGNRKESMPSAEQEATNLFLCGVSAERGGKLYEAIQYYRRAVQLVPDIEWKVSAYLSRSTKGEENSDDESVDNQRNYRRRSFECCDSNSNPVNEDLSDLVSHFTELLSNRGGLLCEPLNEHRMMHISCLPHEVFLEILKWVVSSDLDMRSLEQFSLVCRGFYLCARDEELWRLACQRVWGVDCESPNMFDGCWRQMFVERPRLRFNGSYISKTTYVRPGESSFQDANYRPWHMVDYFRYLRFFPDGIVLMLTTADEPVVALPKLRFRNPRHPTILIGHYRWASRNTVMAVLKRNKSSTGNESSPAAQPTYRYRRLRHIVNTDPGEQTFHMELEIIKFKDKSNYKLEWRHYFVHTLYRNGQESVSEFDLTQTKFPAFWFSCVKSYNALSESPLQ